jgi:hypothetical protein
LASGESLERSIRSKVFKKMKKKKFNFPDKSREIRPPPSPYFAQREKTQALENYSRKGGRMKAQPKEEIERKRD